MDGQEMCKLGKEEFLDQTPGCVGDILYEHLQLLQQEAERNEMNSPTTTETTETIIRMNNNIKDQNSCENSLQQQQGEVLYEELQLLQPSNHEKVSFLKVVL